MVTEQTNQPKMRTSDVSVFYGDKKAVDGVSIDIPREFVTAFIGPSGCGKSTFLRALNRMNDTIPSARVEGTIELDGEDIYRSKMDVVQLRALAIVSFIRLRARRNVDLPQPDGPMKAVTYSVGMSIETESMAFLSP